MGQNDPFKSQLSQCVIVTLDKWVEITLEKVCQMMGWNNYIINGSKWPIEKSTQSVSYSNPE